MSSYRLDVRLISALSRIEKPGLMAMAEISPVPDGRELGFRLLGFHRGLIVGHSGRGDNVGGRACRYVSGVGRPALTGGNDLDRGRPR